MARKNPSGPLCRAAEKFQEVCVWLHVSHQDDAALRGLARKEGRKGWSSAALTQAVTRHVAACFERDEAPGDRLIVPRSHGRCTTFLSKEDVPALVREATGEAQDTKDDAQAKITLGYWASRTIAQFFASIGDETLLRAADAGYDIAQGAMREIAKHVGERAGLGNPTFIPRTRFDVRSSPDDLALDAVEALNAARLAFAQAVSDPTIIIGSEGICRVRQTTRPYTAVVLSVSIPGKEILYAAWPVERPAVD